MPLQFEKWFRADLSKKAMTEWVGSSFFTNDNLSNIVGVELYDGMDPVDVPGTIQGIIILPNDGTITVNGSRTGNKAWIELPSTALALDGMITITIRATVSDRKVTLVQCRGRVNVTDTGMAIDPDDILLHDTSELMELIGDLRDVINEYTDIIMVQDTQPDTETNKLWLKKTTPDGVSVPTMEDLEEVSDDVADLKNGMDSIIKTQATQPTEPLNKVWVDTSTTVLKTLPEVKDNEISAVDTWSSQKINAEIDEALGTKPVNKLNLLCANCGSFKHVDPGVSTEVYKQRWRQLLNESRYDILGLDDVGNWFDWNDSQQAYEKNISTLNALFDESIGEQIPIIEDTKIVNNRIEYNSHTVFDMGDTVVVEGETYTAIRHTALKYIYPVNGKIMAVYVVHCASSPGVKPSALRQLQYGNLIADASAYDYSVFMGDLNAQDISEYKIFTDSNYRLANGGYLGVLQTLRTIPADNIIVSPNMFFDYVSMENEYNLNTDHYPLRARVRFK